MDIMSKQDLGANRKEEVSTEPLFKSYTFMMADRLQQTEELTMLIEERLNNIMRDLPQDSKPEPSPVIPGNEDFHYTLSLQTHRIDVINARLSVALDKLSKII